jgi:hypothetical protein
VFPKSKLGFWCAFDLQYTKNCGFYHFYVLGGQRWWCLGFIGTAIDEVLGRPGIYIDKTVNHQAAGPAPRNLFTLRRALDHKRGMWSQGDVWLFIFYSKYQMPNYELFDSKKLRIVHIFINFRGCFMGPNFLGKQVHFKKKVSGPRVSVSSPL